MIATRFSGDDAALRRLRGLADAAESGIARAIAKLGIDLRNTVRQDKLSGQVLHPRSGSLRDGIAVRMDRGKAAVSATIYSDTPYAAAQEYGFTGRVNVRASLRRVTVAFGRPIAAVTIGVGAYSRRMDLPQRSFLRSSLDDIAPYLGSEIQDALREALR